MPVNANIGSTQARRGARNAIKWLVRDEFATALSAGAVNGTVAEPGPGTRTASGDASISGGTLLPGTGYVLYPALARSAGRVVIAKLTTRAARSTPGWYDGSATRIYTSDVGVTNYLYAPGPYMTSTNGVANDIYVFALRPTAGCMVLINKRLLWVNSYSAAASLLPGIRGGTAGDAWNWLRVPDALWLPTPLVSDGFGSAFGTSDGLGHAEGVAGGLGAGGNGVTWTQQAGTWGISSGKSLCSATSGGIGIATAPAGTINVMVGAALTRSAGAVGIVLRYLDANNYVYALHNGTNAQLVKVVAGTPTTLVNAAATYSAGARLVVRADLTKFRLYYNDVFIGTEQVIADASLQTGAAHGLYADNTTDTIDDFVTWACGNEGQYDILDKWSLD